MKVTVRIPVEQARLIFEWLDSKVMSIPEPWTHPLYASWQAFVDALPLSDSEARQLEIG